MSTFISNILIKSKKKWKYCWVFFGELACSRPHSCKLGTIALPYTLNIASEYHLPRLLAYSYCQRFCSSICDPCHMPCSTLWRCFFNYAYCGKAERAAKNASTAQRTRYRSTLFPTLHTGCVWHSSRANPNGNMRKLSRLLFTEIIKRVKCGPSRSQFNPVAPSCDPTPAQPLAQKWQWRRRRQKTKYKTANSASFRKSDPKCSYLFLPSTTLTLKATGGTVNARKCHECDLLSSGLQV